jgi:phage protein D
MAQKAYQVSFGGAAVDEDFYGDVVSLTVDERADTATVARIRLLTALTANGTWRWFDDDRLSVWTPAAVKVGFAGPGGSGPAGSSAEGLQPVFDGYVTSVNAVLTGNPDNDHVEVTALDTGVLMSLEEKVVRWPDMSDGDIVTQVVSGYGVDVNADPTDVTHAEQDTTVIQRGTDIQFVRQLARRNGMEFWFETDAGSGAVTANLHAPQLDATPQPVLAVQFGDDSNLARFAVRVDGQRPLAVKVEQIDVQANQANTGQAGDTALALLGQLDLNAVAGGPLGGLVTPREALGQMLLSGPPTSDPTELRTLAQALRDESGWFLTADGEINSEAYQAVLRPHRPALVKGAGRRYSGRWYVTRVIHEITGDGGYRQRFEARRNALDLTGDEQFGSAAPGVAPPGA